MHVCVELETPFRRGYRPHAAAAIDDIDHIPPALAALAYTIAY